MDDFRGYVFDQFQNDPLTFAISAYPWAREQSRLYPWQEEVLEIMRVHLMNPKTEHEPLKISVATGHGAGCTALLAMVNDWALSTMGDTRVIVTANTHSQLIYKTAVEFKKWGEASISHDLFERGQDSFTSIKPGHERSWRTDFIPASSSNPEAFAGLCNEGRRTVVLFDECAVVDDAIFEVCEGVLTDSGSQLIFLAVGKGLSSYGYFNETFSKERPDWKNIIVDSRDIPNVDKGILNRWINDYGESSDFCRIRIRGLFPKSKKPKE